jgi:hypothetical protein
MIKIDRWPEFFLPNMFFASCWEIVLPPPDCRLLRRSDLKRTLKRLLESIPLCSKKRESSVAINALIRFDGICE